MSRFFATRTVTTEETSDLEFDELMEDMLDCIEAQARAAGYDLNEDDPSGTTMSMTIEINIPDGRD